MRQTVLTSLGSSCWIYVVQHGAMAPSSRFLRTRKPRTEQRAIVFFRYVVTWLVRLQKKEREREEKLITFWKLKSNITRLVNIKMVNIHFYKTVHAVSFFKVDMQFYRIGTLLTHFVYFAVCHDTLLYQFLVANYISWISWKLFILNVIL